VTVGDERRRSAGQAGKASAKSETSGEEIGTSHGQKIHPIGFRLSVNKNWSSRWLREQLDFASMLNEDLKVRTI